MSSREPEVPSSIRRGLEDRVMELEVENSRLQRLVAELLLKNQQLRDDNEVLTESASWRFSTQGCQALAPLLGRK
jgi:hypothetical protein